ncbi:MAG: hypothetical protein M1814_005857 [Vezdaea aestivalis]|nr:MAG: hypothetical protein M1814_005857 [Vezdaea aestivalis]
MDPPTGKIPSSMEIKGGLNSVHPPDKKKLAKLELGVAVALFNWSVLTLAVKEQWGGSDSEAKREWFAGQVFDLARLPNTELEDLETILLQVMDDEFETNVDDDSSLEVAMQIMEIRQTTMNGSFALVDKMNADWVAKKGKVKAAFIEMKDQDNATDSDSLMSEDSDIDMQDCQSNETTSVDTKTAPEIDEDGFTKVLGKRGR